ncbi:hypothetical protein DFH11DRAFT_1603346 [Phellopilus nigrolimitatus]|nr:hypothetical protein DFH11DRAFT_1603346 [Phellopilus nigrolimitatus]
MKLHCMRSFIKPEVTQGAKLNPWHLGYPTFTKQSPKELVASHFNALVESVFCHYGILEKLRYLNVLSCEFADRPNAPVDWTASSKPDIIANRVPLHELEPGRMRFFWEDANAAWVLKEEDTPAMREESRKQLSHFASHILRIQCSMRFFLGVALLATTLIFYTFDRSGDIASEAFDIRKNPEKLCRVIIGLSIVDGRHAGMDTLYLGGNCHPAVFVNETLYKIIKTFYIDPERVGRGVRCLLTENNGIQYVIKDSWIDRANRSREYALLEKLRGLEGVVQIVEYEFVTDGDRKDTTETDRWPLLKNGESQLFSEGFVIRDHYRMVMEPYGDSILDFHSLPELLMVIKDIIRVIQALHRRNILHRDISIGNIILVSIDGSSLRKGVLIDFDNATDFSEHSDELEDAAGTYQFMARGVLEVLEHGFCASSETHDYYHDLESLFYVLCWICTAKTGPHNARRAGFCETGIGSNWHQRGVGHSLAYKRATMEDSIVFGSTVLSQFSSYFDPIRSCIKALHNDLFVKVEQSELKQPDIVCDRDELCDGLCEVIDETLHELTCQEHSSNTESGPDSSTRLLSQSKSKAAKQPGLPVTDQGNEKDTDTDATTLAEDDVQADGDSAINPFPDNTVAFYAGSKRERSIKGPGGLKEPKPKRARKLWR